jgi:hypothetical protein
MSAVGASAGHLQIWSRLQVNNAGSHTEALLPRTGVSKAARAVPAERYSTIAMIGSCDEDVILLRDRWTECQPRTAVADCWAG